MCDHVVGCHLRGLHIPLLLQTLSPPLPQPSLLSLHSSISKTIPSSPPSPPPLPSPQSNLLFVESTSSVHHNYYPIYIMADVWISSTIYYKLIIFPCMFLLISDAPICNGAIFFWVFCFSIVWFIYLVLCIFSCFYWL